MRQRPASRLLVIDPEGKILLLRFAHKAGALAGSCYWSTPGGGLEAGETFEQAAMRELQEETGIVIDDAGPQIAQRQLVLQLASGEYVREDERYFLVRVPGSTLSTAGWTAEETDCITECRWWEPAALPLATEQVWPKDLFEMLQAALHAGQVEVRPVSSGKSE